jgi:hypothetical protein
MMEILNHDMWLQEIEILSSTVSLVMDALMLVAVSLLGRHWLDQELSHNLDEIQYNPSFGLNK